MTDQDTPSAFDAILPDNKTEATGVFLLLAGVATHIATLFVGVGPELAKYPLYIIAIGVVCYVAGAKWAIKRIQRAGRGEVVTRTPTDTDES